MTETIVPPLWLKEMRRIQGTLEAPGAADNPIILSWGGSIARRFPEMASYCRGYTHDEIAWCGYSMGFVIANSGQRPPFVRGDDYKSFMWAQSWKTMTGSRLSTPRQGAICVLPHHVTLFERMEGGRYICLGGNQGDAVKESAFSPSSIEMVIWPSNVPVIKLPGTLSFSNKHSNLWLQRSLNILSGQLTPPLDEDGDYGENTYELVMEMQKSYHIPLTGIAGSREVAAIEAELAYRHLNISDV